MIRRHDFNSQWWGEPVGIVDDAAFFQLSPEQRALALTPYRWVEFKSRLQTAPPLEMLNDAGFILADTQLEFRIALKNGAPGACGDVQAQFADDAPFELREEDLSLFEHERYRHVPGSNSQRINRRYFEWGRQLIRDHPACCLQITARGARQGWFLSRPAAGLNLTIAMLHREARIPGFVLYERALQAYAARGHRMGWASFSVLNTAVLNIYARLGARFTAPTGVWLWTGGQATR